MKTNVLTMGATSIVVGLNGALQKRFVLPPSDSLIPGNVHRASAVQTGLGGKGQDVAVTLSCLGYCAQSGDENIQLAQFIGTDGAGETVYNMLVDTLDESAMGLTVRTKSGMRTCTSVVAADATTELVEPSGEVEKGEIDQLLERLDDTSKSTTVNALCIMGSMPPGCPNDLYAQIYQRVVGESTVCVIDSVNGVAPLLEVIAEFTSTKKAPSTIYKMNASELCKLAGVQKSNNEADGVSVEELEQGVIGFVETFPGAKALEGLAITDGKHPAYFASFENRADGSLEFSLYTIPAPKLKEGTILFPIGAGDSVAAGTMAAWRLLEGETTSTVMSEDIVAALSSHCANDDYECTMESTKRIITSFAFGLACGSGSKYDAMPCHAILKYVDMMKLLLLAMSFQYLFSQQQISLLLRHRLLGCMQEENSVLEKKDVLSLFSSMGRPSFLARKNVT